MTNNSTDTVALDGKPSCVACRGNLGMFCERCAAWKLDRLHRFAVPLKEAAGRADDQPEPGPLKRGQLPKPPSPYDLAGSTRPIPKRY